MGFNKKCIKTLLTLSFFLLSVPLFGQKKDHVLFISSYAYDWPTVPLQLKGFSSQLDSSVDVSYIFMDSEKVTKEELWPLLEKRIDLQAKEHGAFTVIVADDDNALHYVFEHKDTSFKGIPVVFLGIDSATFAEEAYRSGEMTGLIEQHYNAENVTFALQLCPTAKTINIITDNTVSGIASRVAFINDLEKVTKLPVGYINTSMHSRDSLKESFTNLQPDSIVILLNFTFDANQNYYGFAKGAEFAAKYSTAPIFSPVSASYNMVGGVLVDYEKMGMEAGKILRRVLNGEQPHDITPYAIEPMMIVNYSEVKKHKLTFPKNLQGKITVRGKPQPYLLTHYTSILGTAIVIIFLLLVFIFLRYSRETAKQRKLIVELKKAKSIQEEFLSRMSHDMRTPMNAVIGLANFGLRENDIKKSQGYFHQIINSGNYLMGLLNDLLDMNKLESGKVTLNPQDVGVDELVDDILTIIAPRAQAKNISLLTDFSHRRFSAVHVDKQRVEQLLINILNNAVKYTNSGGQVLWSIIQYDDSSGPVTMHIIKDNGVGMSAEFQKELFRPFMQERNTLSSTEGGSGLGLAISKSLAELMGGTITCKSVEGQGSTFTVILPITVCDEATTTAILEKEKNISEEESLPENVTVDLSGKVALVCEDNEINMMIVQKLLEDKGCKVVCAQNGMVGVEKATAQPFDFILMDIRMPVLDGLEAAKQIRMQNTQIPIIALSANAYSADINKSHDAGMNAHLTKPIDANKLYATILDLLSKQ
jgi:signal transduction histidine kinase